MSFTKPEYWDERYAANKTPWDLHGVPNVLVEFLQHRRDTGTVLIPGCGSAYEVRTFRKQGWRVVAIDFAANAVERARSVLAEYDDCVRRADFFTDSLGGPFNLIYERTFLCSMPPERWPDYARRAAELLRPGGLIAGVFVYGEHADPPPFPLSRPAASALFSPHFMLAEDCAISPQQSLPLYAGKERWQVWRRK